MKSGTVVLLAVGIVAMAITGFINTHTDETSVILLSVLVLAFGLGFLRPHRSWRWGLLVGLTVPLSQALFHLLGLRVPYPNDLGDIPTSFVALAPALIGAHVGAFAGKGVFQALGRSARV